MADSMEVTVKNTFIDLVEPVVMHNKRSSSLPRSWKPANKVENLAFASDASTVDSDDVRSVSDLEASSGALSSSCSDSEGGPSEQAVRTVLCLSDAIGADAKRKATKLSSKARLFEPVQCASLPAEICSVLATAHASLCASPDIFNVRMSEGVLGATTTIVGSYTKGSLKVMQLLHTLSMMQMALLEAAAESTNTYILGYEQKPFMAMGNDGFSFKIGSVPALQDEVTCWDTYQKGFCPRAATCRWCHPNFDSDFAKVVVMLNEVGQ